MQRSLFSSFCLGLFPGKTELRLTVHVLPPLFVLMEGTSVFGNMDYIQLKIHLTVYVTPFKKLTTKEQIVWAGFKIHSTNVIVAAKASIYL